MVKGLFVGTVRVVTLVKLESLFAWGRLINVEENRAQDILGISSSGLRNT